MQDKLPVIEHFGPTIQGEGALVGQISYFLRFGGCPYRCSWCDSMHAVDPKQIKKNAKWMTEEEIIEKFPEESNKTWVTLTGGDPCMWELDNLCAHLWSRGYRITVETQGSVFKEWLTRCDLVTCSPKPPSSGMVDKFNPAVIQQYQTRLSPRLILKIVIFDDKDLDWAEKIHKWANKTPMYLSSGTPTFKPFHPILSLATLSEQVLYRYRQLADNVLKRPALHDCVVGMQNHVLLWGTALGH